MEPTGPEVRSVKKSDGLAATALTAHSTAKDKSKNAFIMIGSSLGDGISNQLLSKRVPSGAGTNRDGSLRRSEPEAGMGQMEVKIFVLLSGR